MAERLTDTRESIDAEYPMLMADFLLDRVLEHEIDATEARVMYQVLTDEPIDIDPLMPLNDE